ncbi:MAG: RNA-binding protein [Candidatus Omnitrophica bacterium]|nr:RNA-binding protein [Candidatus Omnitrophota bacterium]
MSEQSKKLYVGNMSFQANEQDLSDLLTEKGLTATSVAVISDKYTNRSKGFGFVEFATAEEAEKAIDLLNGQELKGRELNVNIARPKEDKPRTGFRNNFSR